jgi:AcrR family transcriptional regulator
MIQLIGTSYRPDRPATSLFLSSGFLSALFSKKIPCPCFAKNKTLNLVVITNYQHMKTELSKATNGKVKNKELTKRTLINAVGELLRTQGFKSLRITRVARQADVDTRLVYRYFGNVKNLIERYVIEKDYWISNTLKLRQKRIRTRNDMRETLIQMLEGQFTYFLDNEEMQRLVIKEITEKNTLMDSVSRVRENIGSQYFTKADKFLKDTESDIRAISALLVAGVYYLILHSKTNTSTFCEIDIKKPEGRDRILKAIRQLMTGAFEKPGMQQANR